LTSRLNLIFFLQLNKFNIHSVQNIAFSELVVKCQGLIRQFAYEQLKKLGVDESDANLRAASCVSQRDIQVCDVYALRLLLSVVYFRGCLRFTVG